MSLFHVLLVTSPLWVTLSIVTLWLDRQYIGRWVSWRNKRPLVGEPDFHKKLALWKERKPVK